MKRFSALVICFAILMSCAITGVYANEEALQNTSGADMLKAFSVIDGISDYNSTVTRKELAKVVFGLTSLNTADMVSGGYFTDVKADSEYAPYINALKNLGYISGYSDGTFRPDDVAKYGEAVTMMVGVTGYTQVANAKGGYPAGYMMVANTLDITEGIGTGMASELTYGDLYTLCANALKADIMELTSFEKGNPKYTVTDRTLMEANLGIYEVEGVIEGNDRTRLRGGSDILPYHIYLNGHSYYMGNTDIDKYLGYYVTAYITESDLTVADEVLYFEASPHDNEVITLNFSDIVSIDNGKITAYDVNNKKKTYSYSLDAGVVYNEICITEPLSKDLFKGMTGNLTLICNGKNTADAVIIEAYTDYVVSSVDYFNNILYDVNGKTPLDVDMQSDNPYFMLQDKEGNELYWVDVKKNHVLSVYASMDNGEQKYTRAIVSKDIIAGTIKSVTQENGKIIVEIGENAYTVTDECALRDAEKIKLGNGVNVSLNPFGDIAAIRFGGADDYSLGYLYGIDTGKGLDAKSKVRIMNSEGMFATYILSDKALVDGIKYEDVQKVISHLEVTSAVVNDSDHEDGIDNPTSGRIVQLVRYKTNSQNEVTGIDTACDENKNLSEFKTLSGDNQLYMSMASGVYYRTASLVNGTVALNSDYLLFQIPEMESWSDEDAYEIKKGVLETEKTYTLAAYGIGNSSVGRCAVVTSEQFSGALSSESRYAMIAGIGKTLYNDDEHTYIEVFYQGKKKKLIVADDITFSDDTASNEKKNGSDTSSLVGVGDIILYGTDNTGLVINIIRQYSAADDKILYNASTGSGTTDFAAGWKRFLYAYVNEAYEDGYVITPIDSRDNLDSGYPEEIMWKITCPVVVYDSKETKDKVRIGSLGEIVSRDVAGDDCTKFIFRQYGGQVWSIFIIK